jgi:hypothetical protein
MIKDKTKSNQLDEIKVALVSAVFIREIKILS